MQPRAIHIGRVDSRWLFNHIYVGALFVDARASAAFADNTICGAISIPPVDNCSSLADIQCCMDITKLSNRTDQQEDPLSLSPRKRNLRDIVVFGDREQLHAADSWMYKLLQLFVDDGLAASVKILDDCVSEFCRRYPFYTTKAVSATSSSVMQSGAYRVTYPNEIIEGFLYLGNMWQAESPQVIQDLGITHIVNATLDLGNIFVDKGVLYHEVKVRDTADADISACFDSTYQFIRRAKLAASPVWAASSGKYPAKPYRVLVHCTQGISRSATLVIMYLMRAHKMSLVQAFNFAHAGRGVIIPNEGFLRALLQEERRLFQSTSNSITEREMDLLIQGKIADRPPPPQRVISDCIVT
jgi:dual specificity MAP kinase phosphatase